MSHWDLDEARCDLNILIGEPGLRGKGVARRAIRLLCAWAFPRMELRRIDICPRDDHIPAIRCYRGAGARFGEIRPEVVTFRGEVVCFRELYFLREDFELPDAASGG
jgi:RimJ/RimL family protein N-acetyltransferase